MDPASAMLLFVLFQAAEKAIGYAGGKIADSMGKPIFDAIEDKAKWLSGTDETAKRWEAFVQTFNDTKKKLVANKRHPELSKQIVNILENFDLKTLPDNKWLDDLTIQLEKASLVSEKPDEFLVVELFSRVLPNQPSRADLSETMVDFISVFQDALFAQTAYQETMFKRAQWQKLREPRYDTRERYISQVIDHNENLDFVGIPELKDRQALRIEDVFISLQTNVEEKDDALILQMTEDLPDENINKGDVIHLKEIKPKIARRLPVNQALTESQKIIVLGDPGSGKTTLLKYIVLAFAESKADKLGLNEIRLPIFIRLYDYVTKREVCGKEGFSFTDYLNKYCTDNLQLHLPPDFFQQALDNGECCVCFDGLDELGTAGLRREITQTVSAMANRYPRNRFIVTSRIVGYDDAPLDRKDFMHHTVQPLNDEDIKLFVEKWYQAREKDLVTRRERTAHLIKTIMAESRIKSLASNPLMLTIIALVHRIEAELPNERVKLYDKCVTTLVETWDKVRGLKTTLRRRLLEKLAYWMHSQPGEKGRTREVREGNLRLQLKKFLEEDPKLQIDEEKINEEVENFIILVKTRSGLLIERGEDIYTFSHLTFQEYLAACDLEKRLAHSTDAIWEEIKSKLHDAHWREVVLLLLGSLNRFEEHNTDLVGRIYKSSDMYEPILHRYLFLAAQALSDHVEIASTLHNAIIDGLLKLDVSGKHIRLEAFDYLKSFQGDGYAKDGLLKLASDGKVDATVRRFAAEALGELGHENEAGKLLLAIVSDEKVRDYVRFSAAEALAKLGNENEARKWLLTITSSEKVNASVRYAAAQALAKLGNENEARKWLLTIASDEKVDATVRHSTLEVLGKLGQGNEDTLNGLLIIANDKKVEDYVRHSALVAIGKLGQGNEAILNGLLILASDEKVEDYVRRSALGAIGKLGQENEPILDGLLKLASDEKVDATVRHSAAEALGELGHENEAGKWLLTIASDQKVDATVRRSAAEALGELGQRNEPTLNGLLTITSSEKVNASVRYAAAQALVKLGNENEARKWLLTITSDEKVDASVRFYAAQALAKLGNENEAGKRLLTIASDEKVNASVRFPAAEALAKLGNENEARKWLLIIASDEKVEDYARRSAAEALGELGQENEAGKWLLALASNEKVKHYVRHSAIQVLVKFGQGNEAILNGLLIIASDEKEDTLVRYFAREALKQILG